MLRAGWVCQGWNHDGSAYDDSSCLTEAPYDCVLAPYPYSDSGSMCRMNNAQYIALGTYGSPHCSYNYSNSSCYSDYGFDQECGSRVDDNACYSSTASLTNAVDSTLSSSNCSYHPDSGSCDAAVGCAWIPSSDNCTLNREGVNSTMSDIGANAAVVAYAMNRRALDICAALGDDPTSCDATDGCRFNGCLGSNSQNHAACGAKNSSTCQADNCVWTYSYNETSGNETSSCTGPSGCDAHTDSDACTWNNSNCLLYTSPSPRDS